MNITYRKISELKPYKNNAKKHPKEQIERIAESIRQFGFTQPVLIDKDNIVVAGHGRILGAKKAGLKEIPTVCMDDLTEEQIKAYRLIDNKLNESPWDFPLLDTEIEQIEVFDMSLFGFDADMNDTDLEKAMKEVKFKVKSKFLVIVTCDDEKQMNKAQKKIKDLGYKCESKKT